MLKTRNRSERRVLIVSSQTERHRFGSCHRRSPTPRVLLASRLTPRARSCRVRVFLRGHVPTLRRASVARGGVVFRRERGALVLAARFGQARPRAREENWVSDAFAVSGTRRPRRTESRTAVAAVECMQMAQRTFLRGKPPTTRQAVRPRALQCQRAMHGRRWLSHPSSWELRLTKEGDCAGRSGH